MIPHAFILEGDCVELLRSFPDASIDAVVTDPPYGLSKEPDTAEVLGHWLARELREHAEEMLGAYGGADWALELAETLFPDEPYQHRGGGFMGKTWDSFVPGPEVWREVLRVLKPGGHLVSFFGTRTYDLGCMAIRLAGFQIRDQLAWIYGTGFPKSKNVALAIDKAAGVQGDRAARFNVAGEVPGERFDGRAGALSAYVAEGTPGEVWQGWGTGLKPAQEPIVLARKPLVGTVAANVLEHGTGGINVDACRVGSSGGTIDVPVGAGVEPNDVYGTYGACATKKVDGLGRWPANLLLDEHAAAALDEQTGDSGDPSRFFYIAKAGRREREAGLYDFETLSAGELTGGREDGSAGLRSPRAGAGRTSAGRANTHPTVKPLALMRWLVRLITPPGGTVLDPFAGSGSTGCAAVLEGFHFVGCELSDEYVALAEARIAHWREIEAA